MPSEKSPQSHRTRAGACARVHDDRRRAHRAPPHGDLPDAPAHAQCVDDHLRAHTRAPRASSARNAHDCARARSTSLPRRATRAVRAARAGSPSASRASPPRRATRAVPAARTAHRAPLGHLARRSRAHAVDRDEHAAKREHERELRHNALTCMYITHGSSGGVPASPPSGPARGGSAATAARAVGLLINRCAHHSVLIVEPASSVSSPTRCSSFLN